MPRNDIVKDNDTMVIDYAALTRALDRQRARRLRWHRVGAVAVVLLFTIVGLLIGWTLGGSK